MKLQQDFRQAALMNDDNLFVWNLIDLLYAANWVTWIISLCVCIWMRAVSWWHHSLTHRINMLIGFITLTSLNAVNLITLGNLTDTTIIWLPCTYHGYRCTDKRCVGVNCDLWSRLAKQYSLSVIPRFHPRQYEAVCRLKITLRTILQITTLMPIDNMEMKSITKLKHDHPDQLCRSRRRLN